MMSLFTKNNNGINDQKNSDDRKVVTSDYWRTRYAKSADHDVTFQTFMDTRDPSVLSFVLPGLGHNKAALKVVSQHRPMIAMDNFRGMGAAKKARKASKGFKGRRGPAKGKKKGFPTMEIAKIWNTFSQSQYFMRRPFHQLNQPFYVCQSIAAQNILTLSASVDTNGAAFFTVGGLNQIGNFTGLFDQYKIIGIECWINLSTTGTVAVASAAAASQYTSYIDYDDATAAASYAVAIENENAITSPVIEGHYHSWVPHVAVASYSGTFTSFTNEVAPWIDAASTGVQHYGLKVSAQVASTVNPIVFTAKLHMLWRQIR